MIGIDRQCAWLMQRRKPRMRRNARHALLFAGALLFPCIGASSAASTAATTNWRSQAETAESDGRYVEALQYIAFASAQKPGDQSLKLREQSLRRKMIAEQSRRIKVAKNMRRTGDAQEQKTAYYDVLLLDPTNKDAKAALREMERRAVLARIEKTNPQTRRAIQQNTSAAPLPDATVLVAAESNSAAKPSALANSAASNNQGAINPPTEGAGAPIAVNTILANAHHLAAQKKLQAGDKKGALAHLEKHAGITGSDDAIAERNRLRFEIADALFSKGLDIYDRDLTAAISLWREAVATDPAHNLARTHLDKALVQQRALKTIKQAE